MAFVSIFSRPTLPQFRLVNPKSTCRVQMKKPPPPGKKPRSPSSETKSQPTPAAPPGPPSPETMLLEDLDRIRAKRKSEKQSPSSSSSALFSVKSVVDTVLLWNFFLVVGLLVWLGVALVPHFVSKNDVLLDPWLALWQPFIQPVLGVLMLGTIVQGTTSFISSKD